jgi:FAD/FMN-containing dehydrogenase
VHDEVIISTDRMTGVTGVDTEAGTVSARAGTTLADVDAAAAAAGMAVPLDLGARASCAIGGNVATNAGGARLVRYGSLRSTVLGLEAVLPSGAVLDLTRPLRKDNTGLDLKQLFIGSEGTLGLITAVTLATPPRPPRPSLALLACPSWAAVRDVLGLARRTLGEALAAAEFMDAPAVGVACARLAPSVRHPLPASAAPYFVLLEAAGVDGAHDAAKMEALLERALASGAAVDGVRADTDAQAAALWAVREGVPIALARAGTLFKYDVSLAVRDMEAVVGECRARVAAVAAAAAAPPAPAPTVVAFGHLGDGNLHLNVSVPAPTPGIAAALEPWVYERVAAAAGSGSAEHGVGIAKRAYLHLSKPAAAVEAMRGVKRVFDPDGIMNPYKVF